VNITINNARMYDEIRFCIEENVPERSLKESAMQSVEYKGREGFAFSELTYLHSCIWPDGENEKDISKIMASVEFVVLAGDILDDLQDKDHDEAPWMKLGIEFAMNLVPLFLGLSKILIHETSLANEKKLTLLNTLVTNELRSLMGQNTDLKKEIVSEEEYFNIIERKSGSFVALACLMGAFNATEYDRDIIEDYALQIGCAAQIENDILGIQADQSFKDIFAKEITLPIIYLLNHKNDTWLPLIDYFQGEIDKRRLQTSFLDLEVSLGKSGAIEYCRWAQHLYMKKALINIDKLSKIEENVIDKIKNKIFNTKGGNV
jgi:competence protein ComQ